MVPTDVFLVTTAVMLVGGFGPFLAWERYQRGPMRPLRLVRDAGVVTRWALAHYARGWASTSARGTLQRLQTMALAPVLLTRAACHVIAYYTRFPDAEPEFPQHRLTWSKLIANATPTDRVLGDVGTLLLGGVALYWMVPMGAHIDTGTYLGSFAVLLLGIQGAMFIVLPALGLLDTTLTVTRSLRHG